MSDAAGLPAAAAGAPDDTNMDIDTVTEQGTTRNYDEHELLLNMMRNDPNAAYQLMHDNFQQSKKLAVDKATADYASKLVRMELELAEANYDRALLTGRNYQLQLDNDMMHENCMHFARTALSANQQIELLEAMPQSTQDQDVTRFLSESYLKDIVCQLATIQDETTNGQGLVIPVPITEQNNIPPHLRVAEDLNPIQLPDGEFVDPLPGSLQVITFEPNYNVEQGSRHVLDKLEHAIKDLVTYFKNGQYFVKNYEGEFVAIKPTEMNCLLLVCIASMDALGRAHTCWKRGIMYANGGVFSKKSYSTTINRIVRKLAGIIGVHSRALRVVSGSAGGLFGMYRLEWNDGTKDMVLDILDESTRIHCKDGITCPSWMPLNNLGIEAIPHPIRVRTQAIVYVIAEDGYLAHLMNEYKIWKIIPCILLYSSGHPTTDNKATTTLLSTELKIPVL